MKDIVLHALDIGSKKGTRGKEKHVRGREDSILLDSQTSNQITSEKVKMSTTTPSPTSRISSGIGSIADDDNHEISPRRSHDKHVTAQQKLQNVSPDIISHSPGSQSTHNRSHNTVSTAPARTHSHFESNETEIKTSNPSTDVKTSLSAERFRGTRNRSKSVLDAKIAKLNKSEEEKAKLQSTVKELQIKVKEEQIRSEDVLCYLCFCG